MLPMNINNFLLGFRESGYSLSDGVAEIIDNSIQANCTYVDIQTVSSNKKVEAILYGDNGRGMGFSELFSYHVIGQSSTFLSTTALGKYGVGGKLSAYNIGLRIDVWSRPVGTKQYMHAYYDLDDVAQSDSVVEIREPEYSELPPEVSAMMPSDANTIVRWSKLDKFPKKSFNSIKSELTTNLGRIFRTYIYHGLKLTFNGSEIKAFDPSMQLKGTYNDEILTKAYDGADAKIRHFEPTFICQDEVLMKRDENVVTLTVTVMPKEVTRKPGMDGDSLARALKLKSNQGNVSFVRSHREVGYALIPNLFGRAVVPEDRYIAVTVEFSPIFDRDFNVTAINKRVVKPQGALRDILQEKLKAYIPIASKVLRQQWNSQEQEMDVDFEAIEQAVERMNILIAKSPEATKDTSQVMVAQKQVELMKLASEIGLNHDASRNYIERKCSRPFVLERVKNLGSNGTHFLDFTFNKDQVIIRVNESHNVYKKVWAPLHKMSKLSKDELEMINPGETAQHSLEALNLMLIAFGLQQALLPVQNFDSSMSGWAEQLDRLIYQVTKSS